METFEGFRRTEGVGRDAHPGELAVPDPVGGKDGIPTLLGGTPVETTEQNNSKKQSKKKAKEKQKPNTNLLNNSS